MTSWTLISPHTKDLGGGFLVRRALPAAQRQAVGPFLFFDHFGPVQVQPADQFDVRPHPHIGLATVTYLFEGAQIHRDNLGFEQRIEPGAINWMTAGRGIVHSERRPPDLTDQSYAMHGLQLWVALPEALEDVAPSFVHTPAEALPEIQYPGVQVRVLVGEAFGHRSPVQTLSPTLYLDVQMAPGATLHLPLLAQEQALYVVQGGLLADEQALPLQQLVLPQGSLDLKAGPEGCRWVLVGGQPLGHRNIRWNFVSTSKARIEQAEQDWAQGRAEAGMGQVPGETERIDLPVRPGH